jgi:hypothetical protein
VEPDDNREPLEIDEDELLYDDEPDQNDSDDYAQYQQEEF